MTDFSIHIDGMHCGACIRRVSQALASTKGIIVKEVRLGSARLSSDAEPFPVEQALSALSKAGYSAHQEE